jgi:hypothetical protein
MAGAISGTRRQLAIAYVAKLMFISEETCVSVVFVSCLGCLSESKQPKCGVTITLKKMSKHHFVWNKHPRCQRR